jgi:hypothetical protein
MDYMRIFLVVELGFLAESSHSLTNLLMVGMISSAPATGREPSASTKSFLSPRAKG